MVDFSDRHHEEENTTSNMMKVICISNTSLYSHTKLPIDIGQAYFIDRSSIYTDEDGNAFGVVHNVIVDDAEPEGDRPGTIVGVLALKHFNSVI